MIRRKAALALDSRGGTTKAKCDPERLFAPWLTEELAGSGLGSPLDLPQPHHLGE